MAQSISVQDFNKLPLDADSIILDTGNTLGYTKEHLSHSLSIPTAILPGQLRDLDPKKLYYTLSYTGRRPEVLADQFTASGFRTVYIIDGTEALQSSVVRTLLVRFERGCDKNRVTTSSISCPF